MMDGHLSYAVSVYITNTSLSLPNDIGRFDQNNWSLVTEGTITKNNFSRSNDRNPGNGKSRSENQNGKRYGNRMVTKVISFFNLKHKVKREQKSHSKNDDRNRRKRNNDSNSNSGEQPCRKHHGAHTWKDCPLNKHRNNCKPSKEVKTVEGQTQVWFQEPTRFEHFPTASSDDKMSSSIEYPNRLLRLMKVQKFLVAANTSPIPNGFLRLTKVQEGLTQSRW